MKIEILKENLKSGLSVVERIVGKNLSLPVLDNVLMDTEDSFLSLISTNLETTIKIWILTKIIKKGKALVPVKFLSNYVSSLPNEKISLELKGQNMCVESTNSTTQIQGHSPDDFPIIPSFPEADVIEVDNARFFEGMAQVVDVATVSQSRPEISGIYFSFFKNNIKMVATDSFRLAEKIINLQKPVKKEFSCILPQRPAREIMSILDGREGNLNFYTSSNQVMFEFPLKELKRPHIQVISRLIEGEYPNYQDIIPSKFKTTATVGREEFINQVKTASLFSSKTGEVRLTLTPEQNKIGVSAKSPDVGEHNSYIVGKITGEPVNVSFNYKYFADGLAKIKSSEVVFEISREDGPCVLRPVGDASYLYVVMPIKSI